MPAKCRGKNKTTEKRAITFYVSEELDRSIRLACEEGGVSLTTFICETIQRRIAKKQTAKVRKFH